MPQINRKKKQLDTKPIKVVIPNDLKTYFTIAIRYQVEVINLPQNHVDEFIKILDAIEASGEVELPSAFVRYIFWKPIRDIFEMDISKEEIVSLKAFYHTVYLEQPNSFVSFGK